MGHVFLWQKCTFSEWTIISQIREEHRQMQMQSPHPFCKYSFSSERIHLASLCCADVYLSSSDSQHSCFIFVGTPLSHADSNPSPHTWFPYFFRRCFIKLILISRLYCVALQWEGKFSSFLVIGLGVRAKAAINVPRQTAFLIRLIAMNCQRLPLLREYVKSEILAGLVIIILRMGISFWIRGGIVSHGSSRAERWGHLVGTETLRHWVVGEEQWYAEKADREGNKKTTTL